jgi:hypothetical protein
LEFSNARPACKQVSADGGNWLLSVQEVEHAGGGDKMRARGIDQGILNLYYGLTDLDLV